MRHEEAPQTEASKDLAKAEEIVVVANARELGQAAAHEPAEEVTVVVAASAEDVVEPIKDDGADAVQVLVVEASAITSEQSQAQTEIAVAELCGTEREHAPSGSIAFNSEELAQAQVETVAEPEQVTLTTEESLNVVVVETQAVANEASTVTVEQVQVQTVVNEGECDVLGSHEPNDAITLASAVVAQTQDEQFAEQEQVVVSDSSSISVETHILTTIDKSEPQAAVPEPVAHDESLLEDDVVVERETCMEQASRTATAESLTEEATSQAQEHIRAEEEHVVMSSTSSVSLEHVEAHVDVAQSQEVVVTSSATVSIVEAEVHHTLIEQERPTAIMQDQSIEVADRVAVSQIEVEQSPSVGFITEPAIVVDVVPLSLDGASEEAQVLPPSSVAVAEEATHSSNIQTSGLDVADDQVTIIAASQTVSIDGADAVVQGSSEVISVIREEIQGVSQEVQVVTEEVVLQDQTLELANSSTITTSLSQQAEVCNQAGELFTTSQIVQESSTLVANAEHDAVSAAESVLVAELNVQEQTQVLETFNVDAEESSVVLAHVASETVVHPLQEQAADVATSEESAPVQAAEQEVELQHSAQAVAIDVAESAAEVHASMEDMQTTTTSPTQELAHGSSEVVAQQQDAAVTFESQEQAAIVSESHALAQVSVEQSDLVQSVAVAVSEQSDVALEDHDHEMPESLSIESAVSTESQEEVFTVSVVSEHVLIQDSLQVETEQAQVTVSEQIAAYDSQVTDYTTTQVESSIHAEPAVATQVSEFHGHASTEVAVSVGAVDGLVHNTDAVVAAQADDICHSASSHIAIAEAHETEIVSDATAALEIYPEADTLIVNEEIVAPEQVVLTNEAPASDDSALVACSTSTIQAQEHDAPHEQQTESQVDSFQDLQKVVESEQAIAATSSQSESSQVQVETNVEAHLEASTIVQVESHVEVAVTELVTESDVGVHDSSLDDGAGVTGSVVGAGIAAAVASTSSNDVEVCNESVSGPSDAAATLQQETALVQSVEGNIDDLSSLGQEVVQDPVQLDVHAESISLSIAAEHGSHEACQVAAITAEIDQQELNEAHSSTPAITTTTSRAEAPAIAVADASAAQSDNEAGHAVVVQDVHHSQDVEAVTTECIQYEAAEEILVQDDAVQEVSAQEPAEQEVSVQKVAALEIVAQEVTVVTEQVVLAEHESSSSIAGGATTTLGVAVAAVGIATSAVSSGDDELETELVSEVPASATISTSTLYSEIVVEEATTRLSDVNTAEQLESHSVESISSLVQVERESDATSTVDIVGASHVPATSHDSQEVGDCVQVIEAEETSVHAVQEEEITQPHQTLAIESVHAVTVVAAADLDVAPAIVASSDSQSSSEADNGHAVLQVEEHALVQADDVDCAHLPQEAAQVEHTIQVATESFEHTVIEHTQVETAIEARKDHLEEGESSSSSDIGFAGTSAISGDVSVADGQCHGLG
ncbi:hypothetical protein BCR44DRAFT_1291439 [Catenaria anguillulae PL171]|uniref:Uncharacterized protein n=1 Tax=Catenaria anguillulae PL171 TaxID=765915 RepID=A0A1Y2H9R2_9FUNG|nr:hypothetical protein BCR44DRAFT_1291439 [Catenaria anguillulae PL171]